MASGIGRGHWKRRRRAELEAKRDELKEKIDDLEDQITFFAEGISDVTRLNEPVDTAIARLQASIDKLEDKRDALQKKIDEL